MTEDIACVPRLREDIEESGGDEFVQIVHTNGIGTVRSGCCTKVLLHALLTKKAHNVIILKDKAGICMFL